MDKFGLAYRLTIDTFDGGLKTVTLPFTVEFDIIRNLLSSANTSKIRIIGLNERSRTLLGHDQFDVDYRQKVTLLAGYGGNLSVLFTGFVSWCYSYREGTKFVTVIEAFDGGFAMATTPASVTLRKSTTQQNVILDLLGQLKSAGLSVGKVSNYEGSIYRANSYSGNAAELIAELTGDGFFVDNGISNCLDTKDCLRGVVNTINSASGLLGTPILENYTLTMEMIMEPRLIVGQMIKIESLTNTGINRNYKICGLLHRGTISNEHCGETITTIRAFMGGAALQELE